MGDGDGADETPRWRDLGDSRDLAAAVRSAYQAAPPPGTPPRPGTQPPVEVDALSLLRTGTRESGTRRVPRRVLAALAGVALTIGAAAVPVTVLARGRTAPPTAPLERPAAGGDATATTTSTSEAWTYEPGATADGPDTSSTTTPAPAATVAPPMTTATSRPRRTATTQRPASPSGTTPPASSPPTTTPAPPNDEPTSGSGW